MPRMRWPSQSEARIVSAILAIGILLGSIPLSAGIAIVPHPKQPTFTLNICEPLQAALGVSGTPIARPATSPLDLILFEHGRVPPGPPKPPSDVSIAPESPPPKALV